MDKKQEFKNLIKKSGLEEISKERWEVLIDAFPENVVQSFLDIFEKFPEEISWFDENYKKKEKAAALLGKDKELGQKMLSEIYQGETEKMQSLMSAK